MKFLGIICILTAGILAGQRMVLKNHNQYSTLDLIILLLKNLESLISYLQIPILEAFSKISLQDSFQNFYFLQRVNSEIKKDKSLEDAWKIGLKELLFKNLISSANFDLLSDFIQNFGKTDAEGQSKHLNYYIEQLEESKKSLALTLKNRDKMIYSVSFFISLLLCILLL